MLIYFEKNIYFIIILYAQVALKILSCSLELNGLVFVKTDLNFNNSVYEYSFIVLNIPCVAMSTSTRASSTINYVGDI